jgi:hypothetical protein
MKKLALAALVLLVAVAAERSAGQAQPQPAPAQPRPADFRDRYEILTERNIFLRNRARPQTRNPSTNPSTGSAQVRKPEQSYVLTGIILEEGRRIAFIENTTTGTTQRLAVGDAVARGKITDVDFHSLEFESAAGERTKVAIGKTLAGSTQGSGAAVATTQPAESSAPIDPNNPNLSPADRLKLRRQQEMKR